MAMCAVEMAMWDAFGKVCGQPLFRLWGGQWRTRIPLAAYLLQSDPVKVVEDARRYREAGYETFKLKIGYDERSDIELTRLVRAEIGADAPLRLDVNGAWTPGTAKRQCRRLLPYDPAYIEQPLELDDLAGHAALRAAQPRADRARRVRVHAAGRRQHRAHAGRRRDPARSARSGRAVGDREGRGDRGVRRHSGHAAQRRRAGILAGGLPASRRQHPEPDARDRQRDRRISPATSSRLPSPSTAARWRCPPARAWASRSITPPSSATASTDITGAYLDPQRPGWFPVKPAY